MRNVSYWLLLLSLSLFALVSGGCQGGKGKYSSPSMSAEAAKKMGVFVEEVEISAFASTPTLQELQLKEAWIEKRVERYEQAPIKKGDAGIRLCVRFDDPQRVFQSMIPQLEPDDESRPPQTGNTIRSKGQVVIAFNAADMDELPRTGTISITKPQSDDLGAEFKYSRVQPLGEEE